MRFLIDTSSITKRRTGTGTYTEGLLNALLIMPETERVIAVGGEINPSSLEHDQKLIHLFPGDTRWHYLLNNVWTGNRFNWHADIAFFPNYFMPYAFPVRSIVTIHDVSFLSHPDCYDRRMRIWYSLRIKQSVSHANQILTVSEASRRNIIHYLGVSGDRIRVIEPGSSLSGTVRRDITAKKHDRNKRFLYVGTIEPRKNILNMLRSFIRTKSPDIQLRMAGQIHCSSSYWKAVRSLVSSDDRIHYLGYLPDEQISKELSDCDVLVNLSRIEGFGMPVMEAILHGKKCLISEDPALRKLAGEFGRSVHGDSVEEITRGFETIDCPSIQAEASAAFQSHYNWKRFSRQLAPLLEDQDHPDRVTALSGSTPVENAIIKALSYSAVFRCPLTLDQLYKRLPGKKCPYNELANTLKRICSVYPDLLGFDGYYVYLKPFDISADERNTDLTDNVVFIKRHMKIIRWLQRLPWIEGIYYTGGTVHGSHLQKRDLDLFIVASSNRVWLLYTLLKLFALMVRKRSLLCFNYLVDESALVIRHQRDLYTAHQLACLRKALPGSKAPDPLQFNQWIYNFFPNLEHLHEAHVQVTVPHSRFWYWMNMILMGGWTGLWSRKGLKNRSGGILWDFHRIKLHTHDHRPFVYEKYLALLEEVMIRIRVYGKQHAFGYHNDFPCGSRQSEMDDIPREKEEEASQ